VIETLLRMVVVLCLALLALTALQMAAWYRMGAGFQRAVRAREANRPWAAVRLAAATQLVGSERDTRGARIAPPTAAGGVAPHSQSK
jgi:uncharacterized membrane protein affecting hemolysin expression